MQVRVEAGDIAQLEADIIVVNLFEGVTQPGGGTGAVDQALDGAISELIGLGDIRGKRGELTTIHTRGKISSPRVLVAGLGKAEDFDIDAVRDLSANIVRHVRKPGISTIATIAHGAGIGGLDAAGCAQAVAEGAVLGNYRFDLYKKADPDRSEIESLAIVEHDAGRAAAFERAAAKGVAMGEATNFTRDLANEPANHLNPTDLARRATDMAESAGLEHFVMEQAEMEAKGMGSLLSVAQGSVQPPKLIRIAYHGREGEGYDIALVGKGITFDTGGISIKPAAGMDAMKGDMTGAASVVGAMKAIADLKPSSRVVAIAPCTENMPGGAATKPGDVVTAMNGTTIEVLNTDAEGRLVLADAVCYARELGARRIVDVATLTGAISMALGDCCYGIFANNDELAGQVADAAATAGEKAWRLPMFKEYGDQIKGSVAEIKNTGGRNAGSITAAKFIEAFVDDVPWVHLDIAGVDLMDKYNGWVAKGASGYSVRALVNLALDIPQD